MIAAPTDAIGLLSHILGGFNISGGRALSTPERVTVGVTEVGALIVGYKAVHKATDSEFVAVIGALIIAHAAVGIAADMIMRDDRPKDIKAAAPQTDAQQPQASPPTQSVAATPLAQPARAVVNEESPRATAN